MKIGEHQYSAKDGSIHVSYGLAFLHDQQQDLARSTEHFRHLNSLRRNKRRPRTRFGIGSFIGYSVRTIIKICFVGFLFWLLLFQGGLAVLFQMANSLLSSVQHRPPAMVQSMPVPQMPFAVVPVPPSLSNNGFATMPPPAMHLQRPPVRFGR